MTDLVKKVAKIIDLDDCTATERAKAAIAVVLKDAVEWSERKTTTGVVPIYFRMYASENGVSLNEHQERPSDDRAKS